MRVLVFLMAAFLIRSPGRVSCDAVPDSAPVRFIGDFSDMRYTEEHAYGYFLELWESGTCVLGTLEVSNGLAGDTPMGLLSPVNYDRKTGALSFMAKLTTGMTRLPSNGEWAPTRDRFTFRGRLRRNTVEGTLAWSDQSSGSRSSRKERHVRLRRVPSGGESIEVKTYGDWRRRIEEVLRFRGPNW